MIRPPIRVYWRGAEAVQRTDLEAYFVSDLDLGEVLRLARRAYDSAVDAVLRGFAAGLPYELKPDGSPVTAMDVATERCIREVLLSGSDFGFIGEETGVSGAGALCRWVVDPIDGTKSYIGGVPDFGVLIGFAMGEEFVAGLAGFPALERVYTAARGLGAWENGVAIASGDSDTAAFKGDSDPAAVSVKGNDDGDDSDAVIVNSDSEGAAVIARNDDNNTGGGSNDDGDDNGGGLTGIVSNPMRAERDLGAGWKTLCDSATFLRVGGNCFGATLVARGRMNFYLDAGLSVYDYAALVPIVEQSGGVMTDWRGARLTLRADGSGSADSVLAANTREHHTQILSWMGGTTDA